MFKIKWSGNTLGTNFRKAEDLIVIHTYTVLEMTGIPATVGPSK